MRVCVYACMCACACACVSEEINERVSVKAEGMVVLGDMVTADNESSTSHLVWVWSSRIYTPT